MNELVSVPISPWYSIPAAVGLLALTFGFAPGVLLHLAVLIYPKGHDRRKEFTAELYTVPFIKRPFWVAGMLVRCLFEGLPARARLFSKRRTGRVPSTETLLAKMAQLIGYLFQKMSQSKLLEIINNDPTARKDDSWPTIYQRMQSLQAEQARRELKRRAIVLYEKEKDEHE